MSKNLSISVCVPVFNEENTLREAVEDLITVITPNIRKLEVIIINDGSTDSTVQIAEQIAREHSQVRIIHHKKKLGVGTCYRDALVVAQGDYFSWFPADHENSAEEFLQCVPYLKQDTIVTCHHYRQDPRSVSRRFISQSYTLILNKLFHLNLKYYNGLTVFPIAELRSLPLAADGFLFASETIIKAIRRGCKVIELSIPLRGRTCGKSTALTFSSFLQMAKDVFSILRKEL